MAVLVVCALCVTSPTSADGIDPAVVEQDNAFDMSQLSAEDRALIQHFDCVCVFPFFKIKIM